jgi:hypothetical protein
LKKTNDAPLLVEGMVRCKKKKVQTRGPLDLNHEKYAKTRRKKTVVKKKDAVCPLDKEVP